MAMGPSAAAADDCRWQPAITNCDQARDILHRHAHYAGAPCLQRQTAVHWMTANGFWVPSRY